MNGSYWIGAWISYTAVSLAGAFALSHRPQWARRFMAVFMCAGSLGLMVMAFWLIPQYASIIRLPEPWPTLIASPLPLASMWALIGGLLFLSATLLSMRRPDAHRVFYALLPLLGAVGVYLWSGDGLLLLMSWEFISAVTYLGLVTTRRARVVWNAGWSLLALSELGGLFLLIALVWLMPVHTSFLHDSLAALAHASSSHPSLTTNIVMVMAMVAFGVKAGLFPVMIWMPMAEPQAPGVVAGIFSGLLTALAISGMLAIIKIAGAGMAWAIILLVLGVLGALSGALYSIVSRHVKRILAYSTLEIMGLIFAAIGIWRIVSLVAPANVDSTFALDGAVVLLVMHAGAKFVLFSATDYTGLWSHTIDGLGGIIHSSGTTALLSLLAILTLGAFPPLGGFLGEWLLLESILKPLDATGQGAIHLGLMVAGAVIAATAAIGVAAYLRWFGFIFLGVHRGSPRMVPKPAREWLWGLGLPLVLIVVAGPGSPWFLPWLNRTLRAFLPSKAPVVAPSFVHPATAAPLVAIGANLLPAPLAQGTVFFPEAFNVEDPYVLLFMALFLSVIVAVIRGVIRRRRGVRLVEPWNGGAVTFTPQTSWSAEGFTHPMRLAFAKFYGLTRERAKRGGAHFYRHTIIDRVEQNFYIPVLRLGRWIGRSMLRVQSGRVTQYIAYVWVAVLVGVVIGALR
ncbi:MAG: proton-conducting transporter membrane subunit [Thermaerobacter sp.]|nr:proton-conducting transporter membrane subunit [Thermaerobacter sp.]